MSKTDRQKEIGGYFGLDLPDHGELYPEAFKLNSGRAAMRAALEASSFKKVWVPAYICTSIIDAAKAAGLKVSLYRLNSELLPDVKLSEITPETGIIYVNYFGLCHQQVSRVLEIYPPEHVLIDNSHALFCNPKNEFATIYSPRKFAGMPDGGLLMMNQSIEFPELEEDECSFSRIDYLLTRLAYSAREGYELFNRARMSLQDSSPMLMSRLSARILSSIPWRSVEHRRKENFKLMHSYFKDRNDFPIPSDTNLSPLCYPLQITGRNVVQIKRELADKDIFTATYWPDAEERASPNSIESELIFNTLFLPIDQRMDEKDVITVVEAVDTLIDGK